MTGALLMASLLRIRASDHLANLATQLGKTADAQFFQEQAARGRVHIWPTFSSGFTTHGWLQAATGVGAQADVWGSLVALIMDAVPTEHRNDLLSTIVTALGNGTIEHEGALRHVPTDLDYSDTTMWENAGCPHRTEAEPRRLRRGRRRLAPPLNEPAVHKRSRTGAALSVGAALPASPRQSGRD